MKTLTGAALAVSLAVIAAPAAAQTQRSGNADARVMQQLQQLSNERAQLQAENARLRQELEQIKKSAEQASSSRSALENRARALAASASRHETQNQESEEQLERMRGQLHELVAKFRETTQTLRDVESEGAQARSQLTLRDRELATCVDRNAGLYNLNAEVLERMENRGFWSAVTEREPFTRLKRVELENLIDGYKYRADELRLEQQQIQSTAQR